MAQVLAVTPRRTFMGRLAHGADLLGELTAVAREHQVRLGRVEAIGAVQQARLGFYDQGGRVYEYHTVAQPLEITALLGNVSLKDDEPICHVHVTLADREGRAYGGHLAEGTVIFACEFLLQEWDGPALSRGCDEPTGLPLWRM